jgi:hypothetical protein
MKHLLEVCTCRCHHLGEYAGNPFSRYTLTKEWYGLATRYILNPEYIHDTCNIIEHIHNNTFASLCNKELNENFKEAVDYTQENNIDTYLIEISSRKYIDQSSGKWLKFNEEQFSDKLQYIRDLCKGARIIWVAPANIQFTDDHMEVFSETYRERIFNHEGRIISRAWIEQQIRAMEADEHVIYPSEMFSDMKSEHVFNPKNLKDITHYSVDALEIISRNVTDKLKEIL